MKAPEPVRDHPNATYVFLTSPLAGLVGWLVSLHWAHVPGEVSAWIGAVVSSLLLVVVGALKRAAGATWAAVWALGVCGVFRRIWKGEDGRPDQ